MFAFTEGETEAQRATRLMSDKAGSLNLHHLLLLVSMCESLLEVWMAVFQPCTLWVLTSWRGAGQVLREKWAGCEVISGDCDELKDRCPI